MCKHRKILPLPPCPGKDAVIRKYEVAAVQRKMKYNKYGDHDPDGLIFVPIEEANRALDADYQPKPLILRANAGDWIEVTLHNLFDENHLVRYFDYPEVPLDIPHKPSMRVSLNPQFLHYDPICDSGINVGYNNREETVGPGESKKYLWYRSFSLVKALHEEEIVVTASGTERFRECVVMIQNGIRMLDEAGELVKTTATEEGEGPDPEDTGERVVFRTVMPADKPRNVGFTIHGHTWMEQQKNPHSREIPIQGAISIGNTFNKKYLHILEKLVTPGADLPK